MSEYRAVTGELLITFELDADDFEFYQGDTVAPGCEIGIDARTGSPVLVDFWGQIASTYYYPMNHSYRVIVNRFPELIDNRIDRHSHLEIFA